MRRAGLALALTALLLLTATPAEAAWRPRQKLLGWMNEVRSPDLELRPRLTHIAQIHAVRMRNQGRIFHSHYQPCSYWGENVGAVSKGRTPLRRLFNAFMLSPPHAANITNPNFHRAGIGVATGGGIIYATLTFCR